MNKKRYIILGALLTVGLIAGLIAILNRGVPAADVAAFTAIAEPEAGTELKSVAQPEVAGMKAVAKNDKLVLHYNEETTEIAVTDLASGVTWYSNPVDREADTLASGYEQSILASQLVLQYRDLEGNLYTYSNHEKSIMNEQFQAEAIPDGLRVTYQLGDASKGIDALPKFISKERFETLILANLPEATANYVKARYMESKTNPGVMERLDAQVEKKLVLNKMVAAFEEAGYTEEDLALDEAEHGSGAGNAAEKPNFTVVMEYRLVDDELVVTIPASQIVEPTTYLVRSIDVLPYFGAANASAEGYMLVPDGSGSLIYLNNGKTKEEQYVQRVYGDDPNNTRWARGMVSEQARMPVYGLKNGNAAWFAEIIQGEGNSSITSSINGMRNSYNTVYASFSLRGEDYLELYTGNKYQEIQILNEQRYQGDLQLRYSFLSNEQASYSGMAALYREHLEQDGVLTRLAAAEQIPFYLDIIGSYDKRTSFLGVPYQKTHALTTFEQAGEIVEQLAERGVQAVNMRYLGWFDRGIQHKTPVKLRLDSVLGDKKELQQLASRLEQQGGMLFPDVAFQYVYKDDLSFTPASDAARFVTREVVELYPYNRAINRMDSLKGSYYLLSAAKLPYYVNKFADVYQQKYDLTGVALRDLGNVVGSDYRVKRVIHRDTAKQITQQSLAKLAEQQETLIVGGHAYAWAYADHLIDVPSSSSSFSITDESVPFYQMVLHGYIPYASKAVNLSDEQDIEEQLLQAIEQGAYPHFTWSYNHSSDLKFTAYDQYFSTQYEIWLEESSRMYREANEVLSQVSSALIVERIVHQPGVVEMRYDNGKSILVNYTENAVTVNGMSIAARNYAIGGDQR